MRGIVISYIILLLTLFMSLNLRSGYASQELIANGGFETSNFDGWLADSTCQVKSYEYPTSPTHKGEYSARVGSVNPNLKEKGAISQTIKVPEDSRLVVSFWYRVEKNSILNFYLRESDGSIIQSWTFNENPVWKPFAYELSPDYAGKSIVLVFQGAGFMEWVKEPTPTLTDRGWEMIPQAKRKNYYPYIDDVSVLTQSSSINAIMKIIGLPSELSTKIYIDGQERSSSKGGESPILKFRYGELHDIVVEKYVYKTENIRYICDSHSISLNTSSDTTIEFSYNVQHLLDLESDHGSTEGTGWHYSEDTAQFSVSPTTISADGILGLLGVRYVFQSWIGDIRTTSPQGQIYMDSPKKATAMWGTDYFTLIIIIGALSLIVLSILYFKILRRNRGP